jgi:hypothetical protein
VYPHVHTASKIVKSVLGLLVFVSDVSCVRFYDQQIPVGFPTPLG